MLTSAHAPNAAHEIANPCPICGQVRKVIDGAVCSWHSCGCEWPDMEIERRAFVDKTEQEGR